MIQIDRNFKLMKLKGSKLKQCGIAPPKKESLVFLSTQYKHNAFNFL